MGTDYISLYLFVILILFNNVFGNKKYGLTIILLMKATRVSLYVSLRVTSLSLIIFLVTPESIIR